MVNPALPPGYDAIFSVLAAAIVALSVAALVSIIRRRHHMSSPVAGLWALAVIVMPILASIAWFLVGNPRIGQSRT